MPESQAQKRWDEKWTESGLPPEQVEPYPLFADHVGLFPQTGSALVVACGAGRGAVWLASLGLEVHAVDLSPVAIELAQEYAVRSEVADRCRFETHDLNDGLPAGEPVDVVACHLFRDAAIDETMTERLNPGGLLAIAVLSEVDHGPGRFRAKPGELARAFAHLNILVHGERDGYAWLLGRRSDAS